LVITPAAPASLPASSGLSPTPPNSRRSTPLPSHSGIGSGAGAGARTVLGGDTRGAARRVGAWAHARWRSWGRRRSAAEHANGAHRRCGGGEAWDRHGGVKLGAACSGPDAPPEDDAIWGTGSRSCWKQSSSPARAIWCGRC
jgi:hypothetical protein